MASEQQKMSNLEKKQYAACIGIGLIVGDGFYSASTATFEEAFRNTQNHPMFNVGRVQKDLFPLANIGDWFNGFSDNPEGPCSDVILVPPKAINSAGRRNTQSK